MRPEEYEAGHPVVAALLRLFKALDSADAAAHGLAAPGERWVQGVGSGVGVGVGVGMGWGVGVVGREGDDGTAAGASRIADLDKTGGPLLSPHRQVVDPSELRVALEGLGIRAGEMNDPSEVSVLAAALAGAVAAAALGVLPGDSGGLVGISGCWDTCRAPGQPRNLPPPLASAAGCCTSAPPPPLLSRASRNFPSPLNPSLLIPSP